MRCYNCMHDKGEAVYCPCCGNKTVPPASPHHLPLGTVIGGRYTLGRALGEGGFGITYIGLDNTLDIPVAVKEYFPYGYSQRNNTASLTVSVMTGATADIYAKGKNRFLEEAKIVARFRREAGIVNVTDFFEENNTAYIVMEYLEGETLRQYLKSQGRLTVDQTITMLTPIMRSLEKIHAAGVIHRDISPDNIMVQSDGSVTLMDFGAARDFDTSNRSMSVMLKHGYAPEEQYRRRGEQGPWTDVYAMCATIYRCITGATPDDSNDRCAEDTLKKPSELGVDISPATEDVLMYGLAVRKKDRCPDMTTLIRRFDEAQSAPAVAEPSVAKTAPVVEEEKTLPADETYPAQTYAPYISAQPEKAQIAEREEQTLPADMTVPAQKTEAGNTDFKTVPADKTESGNADFKTVPANQTTLEPIKPVSVPSQPSAGQPATPVKVNKKKRFPFVIIAVAAVLVIAVVVLVIVNPFGKSHEMSVEAQSKALSDFVTGKLDMSDFDHKEHRADDNVQEEYVGMHPAAVPAATVEIDEVYCKVDLGKTTVGDLKTAFYAEDTEEQSFDNGNAFAITFDASGFWKFRAFTELFETPHSETNIDSCIVKEIILDYDSAESQRLIPFRYQNIMEKSTLKEIVSRLGEPSQIALYTDNNNKAKEVRSEIVLRYQGEEGFDIEFRLRYDPDKDDTTMTSADFYIQQTS